MDFLASINHKLFFRLVETYFLMNYSFQLLERDFLSSFQLLERDFLFSGNHLLESSFLLAKTVTDVTGNHFLKADLILASGNSFSS